MIRRGETCHCSCIRIAVETNLPQAKNCLLSRDSLVDSGSDSPYFTIIRNPTQPAAPFVRPLVLCVLGVFLTTWL